MIARLKPEIKPKPPVSKPTRQRVRVSYITDQEAFLVQEGPEQSEVQWPNGNRTIVSNEHIEKL
jgi:hypothetical protein